MGVRSGDVASGKEQRQRLCVADTILFLLDIVKILKIAEHLDGRNPCKFCF